MKLSLLIASALVGLAMLLSPVEAARSSRLSAVSEAARQSEFVSFVKTYNKSYPSDEFLHRYNIFGQRLATIRQHNAEAEQGLHSWTMAINEFSDLTFEEFKKQKTGFQPPKLTKRPTMEEWQPKWANLSADPAFVDLRQSGLVTGIKNQQHCGGCWAFAAVASAESAHKKRSGKLLSLSEQQILDCTTNSNGCNGGNADNGFQFVLNNGGMSSESGYPFVLPDGGHHDCRAAYRDATFSAYQNLPQNEGAIASAVAHVGTIAVAINASPDFMNYHSGIWSGSCSSNPNDIDHAVAVIGYGWDQPSGKAFYIVKNSWGTTWGVDGYIYLQRGVNKCGIAEYASYMSP